jgi:hypothetical protein
MHLLPEPPRHNATTCAILMKAAGTIPHTPAQQYLLHIDGGANRSITNDSTLLLQMRHIRPYYMSSASQADSIKCTGMGYLPWQAPNGRSILVKCYYSEQATDTILSPSDIVLTNGTVFTSWTQHANMTTGDGHITFTGKTQNETQEFPLKERNGLWYYEYDDYKDYHDTSMSSRPAINRLTNQGTYELMHARLGHPGTKVMSMLHLDATGIPKLTQPPLFCCHTCLMANANKRAVPQRTNKPCLSAKTVTPTDDHVTIHPPTGNTILPGTVFQMDMGFVCGTKYRMKDMDGGMVTSLDGYNSYLIVVDRATRFTWVFLSK